MANINDVDNVIFYCRHHSRAFVVERAVADDVSNADAASDIFLANKMCCKQALDIGWVNIRDIA